MIVHRYLNVRGAAAKGRTETWQGREYYAVPVVALMEGVIWPVNAESPERVLASELAIAPAGWNGRPVFLDHPAIDGSQVSGNTPSILESSQWGIVFNAASSQEVLSSKKLKFEAWLDVARAAEIQGASEELARLQVGEVVEVSVGVFVLLDDSTGTIDGKKFQGTWSNIVPDHLAILPQGVLGACSIEMGCGALRSNAVHDFTGDRIVVSEEPDMRSLRERLSDLIRSTFITNANETSTDIYRLLNEALRKELGGAYFDLMDFKPEEKMVFYTAYGDGGYTEWQRPYELGEGVITLSGEPQKVRSRRIYEVVAASENPEAASVAASTESAEAPLAAACGCHKANQGESEMTKEQKIAAIIANSAGRYTNEDNAYLNTLSDGRLSSLAALQAAPTSPNQTPNPNTQPITSGNPDSSRDSGAGAEASRPAPAGDANAAPGGVTPSPAGNEAPGAGNTAEVRDNGAKSVTLDQLVAAAGPDTVSAFQHIRAAAAAKRATAIKALKDSGRCAFSDADLNAMPQTQLDNLVALAGIEAQAAPVDYSGVGTPRANSGNENGRAPAPPDMTARILAARQATK